MNKIYFLLFMGLFGMGLNAQIVNIPDAIFKTKLLAAASNNQIAKDLSGNWFKIDSNNDGEIQVSEAQQVSYLNTTCLSCSNNSQRIASLEGISSFVNLANFITTGNNLIDYDYEAINNSIVQELDLRDNFKSIKIQNTPNLAFLRFSDGYNPNGDVLVENAPLLTTNFGIVFLVPLSITGNFKMKNCPQVQKLQFTINTSGVRINSVILEDLPILDHINLTGRSTGANVSYPYTVNNLSLQNTPMLNYLSITDTNIENLDLYQLNSGLHTFISDGNKNLANLDVVGVPLTSFNLWGNDHPDLYKICVDDTNFNIVKAEVLEVNSTAFVTPYCNFTPNGTYYLVNGGNSFDYNSDGCDAGDPIVPYVNFSINNGTDTVNFMSNATGSYAFPVVASAYTITPSIENASYFIISPPNINVDFPTDASPYAQNFCFTSNGVHNDLEVTILPMTPARPGFDSDYKIVYRNKGNTTLSGSVTFEYEDDKMDLVATLPVFSSQQTGLLTYDYSDLHPFESREIEVTLNINSPTETPAVNAGDQLNFTAIINPIPGDEFPPDNNQSLKQFVVNSFDPNDKTCIEGENVGTDVIGNYVHYIIRFENTGTFPAENIVVRDMIDLTKFDPATLIPISSGHSFVTRIADNGKVEFIFENIQLPFDDANNDGYIAFKIKTLPTLVLGDTFTNKANIYFDYNFPIQTNTATTTIETLGIPDFEFNNYIVLYPNPTENILNIKLKHDISISSISIYNTLGQLVLVNANPSESIDVSNLKRGSYFIKVISDKGISTTQFIKE